MSRARDDADERRGDDPLVLARSPLRPLAGAAAVGLVGQMLFFEQLPGLNAALMALCAMAVLATSAPRWPARRDDIWIAATVVVLAVACAVRADLTLVWLNIATIGGLAIVAVASRGGARIMDLSLVRSVREAVRVLVAVASTGWTLVRDERELIRSGGRATFGELGPYAGGAVLATPVLGVFVVLFTSADAAFARWVEESFDLWELPGRALVAVLVAWVAAGALAHRAPDDAEREDRRPAILGLEPALATLVLVDALFLVFVAFQITYLFGGRETLDAARMPYSEYARRGFYELIAVGGIVVALLLGLEIVARRRTRPFAALAIGLIGLTGIVLASAAVRLDLYQQAYGWTEQRFYAGAILGLLAAALLILAWGTLRDRVLFIARPVAMAAMLGVVTLNVIGPSAFIARANTDRVIDPSGLPADASRGLDARYLVSLGDGAILTLIERAGSLPDAERTAVIGLLNGVAVLRDLERRPGWQSWNLERQRSRAALATLGAGSRSGRMTLK